MPSLFEALGAARVFDLAQPYFPGMPHHPSHPPYIFGMVKQHGDFEGPAGNSSAGEALAMGAHVGTHIDALCHFSSRGFLHGGHEAAPLQSAAQGIARHGIETVGPIVRRGALLDIAALEGGPLSEDFEILPRHLEQAAKAKGVSIEPGSVVLLRTGWARYFEDARLFVKQVRGPGPGEAGARWLSERGIFAAGSDTLAFEKVPDPNMPVHVHLLVETGIHIIECLNLEALSQAQIYEFAFIAAPLKIQGGTASPLAPIALSTTSD